MTKKYLITKNIAEWHDVVQEAQHKCNSSLNKDLEAYLVFTLIEYLHDTTLLEQKIGEQFLNILSTQGLIQKQALKALADKCLLITGLFPEQISRRMVSANYFGNIGQASYDYLANLETKSMGDLYHQLAKDFYLLVEILLAIRPNDQNNPLYSNPELAYSIWQETNGEYLKQFFILH